MTYSQEEPMEAPSCTMMRWQPIVLSLPTALLIDAAVGYFGWMIWKTIY